MNPRKDKTVSIAFKILFSLSLSLPSLVFAGTNHCAEALQGKIEEKTVFVDEKIQSVLEAAVTKTSQNLIRLELEAQRKIDELWEQTGLYKSIEIRLLEQYRLALMDEERLLVNREGSSLLRYDSIVAAITSLLKTAGLDEGLVKRMGFRSNAGKYSYMSAKHYLLDQVLGSYAGNGFLENIFKNQREELAAINTLASKHLGELRTLRSIQNTRQNLPQIPETFEELESVLVRIDSELEIRKYSRFQHTDTANEIDLLLNYRENYQALRVLLLKLQSN
jgi:hypothetical protein